MSDDKINPAHYKSHPSGVECIEITEHLPFCLGNALKYIWRAGGKRGVTVVEDFKKAQWYLRRAGFKEWRSALDEYATGGLSPEVWARLGMVRANEPEGSLLRDFLGMLTRSQVPEEIDRFRARLADEIRTCERP